MPNSDVLLHSVLCSLIHFCFYSYSSRSVLLPDWPVNCPWRSLPAPKTDCRSWSGVHETVNGDNRNNGYIICFCITEWYTKWQFDKRQFTHVGAISKCSCIFVTGGAVTPTIVCWSVCGWGCWCYMYNVGVAQITVLAHIRLASQGLIYCYYITICIWGRWLRWTGIMSHGSKFTQCQTNHLWPLTLIRCGPYGTSNAYSYVITVN
jgi:hypothetical protein